MTDSPDRYAYAAALLVVSRRAERPFARRPNQPGTDRVLVAVRQNLPEFPGESGFPSVVFVVAPFAEAGPIDIARAVQNGASCVGPTLRERPIVRIGE